MKMFPALKYLLFITILLNSFSCGQYAGNNNYAGGGIGGTGITGVSVGKITAIDLTKSSISVNGVAFSLNGTGITLNGTPAEIDKLKVGMIVKVNGKFDANDSTGKAFTIDFEDNLEGPVDTGSIINTTDAKSFSVLGRTIIVDSATVFEGTTSFDSLKAGNVVEVSGFEAVDGSIHATYIELKEEIFQPAATQVELKGTITNVNTIEKTFVLNNITISYDGILIDDSVLKVGVNIEVKGTIVINNNITLVNVKVEIHDTTQAIKDGEKAEIEGYISEIISSTESTVYFKVNNQKVYVDTSYSNIKGGDISVIQKGIKIEVKGTIESGVLNATKISIESEEHKENDNKNSAISDASKNVGTSTIADSNTDNIASNTDNPTTDNVSNNTENQNNSIVYHETDTTNPDKIENVLTNLSNEEDKNNDIEKPDTPDTEAKEDKKEAN